MSRSPLRAAWHLGWAACVALAAAGQGAGDGKAAAAVMAGAAMAAPGLLGAAFAWRDGLALRGWLLAAWALASITACAVLARTGETASPFLFMPVVAGLLLDRGSGRAILAGAVGSGMAVVGAQAASPLPSATSALTAVLVVAAAAAAMLLVRREQAGATEQAQEAAIRAQGLLAAQPGLLLILTPEGRLLDAHGAAPAALSLPALFDGGLIAAVNAPDRPALLAALGRAAAGGEAEALFTPRLALDRRVVLIVRRLADGDPPRLIAQLFDGTVQFARELGLDAARAEAEAQNLGKSRFLATMSHELRTPLNAVIGFSDIMRQRLFGPLPDRYGEYADSIHQAGGHLLDLINDVLDLSKIEAERYQLAIETFDAREPVSAAVALVRPQAEDKGVRLSAVLPPDVLTASADRRALKQMTLNLLSNAVKFTPAGGSVTVSLGRVDDDLELIVSDTGVGIAPEDLARLGRPFEQAGAADQRAQGTGLGLSLVRSLAELHGGRLTLDSTLGEGAAATVRLPLAR